MSQRSADSRPTALQAAGLATLLLLACGVGWRLDRRERGALATARAADAASALDFRLESGASRLADLARLVARGTVSEAAFAGQSREMLRGQPGASAVAWVDARFALRAGTGGAQPAWFRSDTLRRALEATPGGHGFSPPIDVPGVGPALLLFHPTVPDVRACCDLVAVYPLRDLLPRALPPPWAGEDRVALRDGGGAVLSQVGVGGGAAAGQRAALRTARLFVEVSPAFRPHVEVLALCGLCVVLGLTGGLCLARARAEGRRRRAAEAEARDSEARFRALADRQPVLTWTTDAAGRFTSVNQAGLDLRGRAFEEELGQGWLSALHPDDAAGARPRADELLAAPRPFQYQYRVKDAAGGYRWLLGVGAPHFDEDGAFLGFVGSCVDVTAIKAAGEAVRGREERHRSRFAGAPLPLYLLETASLRLLGANTAFLEHTGYGPDEIAGLTLRDLVPAEDLDRLVAALASQAAGPKGLGLWRHRARSGELRFVDLWAAEDEAPGTCVVVARDVTEERRALELLRVSENRYRVVAENTYDWEYWIDEAGRFLYCSPSCERISGHSAAEFLADPKLFERLVHPDDRELVASHRLPGAAGSHDRVEIEFRIVHKDGEVRWIGHRCANLLGPDGGIVGVRGSNGDITARRAAVEALRLSESRFRSVFDSSSVAIAVSSPDLRLVDINPAWLKLLGMTRDELLGRSLAELSHPEDASRSREQVLAVLAGRVDSCRCEKRYVRKDGEWVWMDVSVAAVRDEAGRVKALVAVGVDIAQRVEADARARDSEGRLEALVGQLEETNAQLAGLTRGQARFIEGAPPEDVFAELLDSLIGLTDSEIGFIGEVQKDAAGQPYLHTHALSNAAWDAETSALFESKRGEGFDFQRRGTLLAAALESGELLVSELPESDPRGGGTPAGHPTLRSFAAIPLKHQAELIGLVGIANWPTPLQPGLIERLDPFLKTATTLIQAARAQKARQAAELERAGALARARDFETLFAMSNAGASINDFDGRFERANEALLQMLGYSDEAELREVSREELIVPADRQRASEAIRRARLMGAPVRALVVRYVRRDGALRWLSWDVSADLKAKRFYCVVTDVTEQLRSEEELRLRTAAVDAAANAIVLCDREGTILWVNKAFSELTGYAAAEAIGETPRLLRSHVQDADYYRAMWDAILAGRVWRGQLVNRRKDGGLYVEEQTITPMRGVGGDVTHFIGIKQDVTWRHDAERRLRQSEERFRGLVQGADVIVWEADPQTREFTFVSDRVERILGHPPEAWLGSSRLWQSRVHPDDREATFAIFDREIAAGRSFEVEYRILAADGGTLWLHDTVRVCTGAVGEVTSLAGVAVDVSRARQLEAALKAAATEWNATFDAMHSALFVLGEGHRIARLNRRAAELTGVSYEACLGRSLPAVGEGEPWETAREVVQAALSDGARVRRQARTPTGRAWDVEAFAIGGALQRMILSLRDETELARLQESVRRSDTMAAMGALVAGVAHEVRNPLFAMSVNIDALALELGQHPQTRELVDALRHERDRIDALMRDLLLYGRPQSPQLGVQRLLPVIEASLAHCRPLAMRRGLKLKLAGEIGHAAVKVDAGRLAEVFDNLIENACQHAPRGSTVMVEAGGAGHEWVRCRVVDQGPGIPPEMLQRIFEPFFTRRKGGTGLGLAIAQRLVEQMGGRLSAANGHDGGAVLTLDLPAVGSARDAIEREASS